MLRAAAPVLRRAGAAALSLLFPPHCAHCHQPTEAGVHLCASCAKEAPRLRAPFCHRCAEPFAGEISGEFTCSNCAGRHLHFTCAVAPYQARGAVRDFIHRFKYQRQFYLRFPLAQWLAEGLADARLRHPALDGIVPVPLHPARQREREFNQAEVLAQLLAKTAQLPVLGALERIRYTSTQTRLNREGRMENLRDAFRVRESSGVRDRHLLLLDDVMTTGSTVDECARVLRRAGAASVRVLTVGRA